MKNIFVETISVVRVDDPQNFNLCTEPDAGLGLAVDSHEILVQAFIGNQMLSSFPITDQTTTTYYNYIRIALSHFVYWLFFRASVRIVCWCGCVGCFVEHKKRILKKCVPPLLTQQKSLVTPSAPLWYVLSFSVFSGHEFSPCYLALSSFFSFFFFFFFFFFFLFF